jgi:hypothetical protein
MTSTGAVSVAAAGIASQNLAAVDVNVFDNHVEGGILQCVRPRTFQQMRDLLDGSVTWVATTTSDARLKRDVGFVLLIPSATYKLYRFTYKDDPKNIEYVGVIAQEVQRDRPEAVTEDSKGYLSANYDLLGLKMQTAEEFFSEPVDLGEIAQAA